MPKKIWRKASRFLTRHPFVKDLISLALIVGVIYFGFKGGMVLALQNSSPMRGVTSNSMKPTFQRGDLLIIEGVDSPSDIKENDIIVFERYMKGNRVIIPKRPIVHRVIHITTTANGELLFKTRGDANPSYDMEIVSPEDVLGRVVYWIPYLGYPSIMFD